MFYLNLDEVTVANLSSGLWLFCCWFCNPHLLDFADCLIPPDYCTCFWDYPIIYLSDFKTSVVHLLAWASTLSNSSMFNSFLFFSVGIRLHCRNNNTGHCHLVTSLHTASLYSTDSPLQLKRLLIPPTHLLTCRQLFQLLYFCSCFLTEFRCLVFIGSSHFTVVKWQTLTGQFTGIIRCMLQLS